MAKIYPRLEIIDCDERIQQKKQELLNSPIYNYNPNEESLIWLPMGDHISIKELKNIRNKILDFMEKQHFKTINSNRDITKFDRELGIFLLNLLDLTPSIAADIEMWAYMNIELMPDLLKARWESNGKINYERYYDPSRNYLGSLWWSAYLCNDKELYRNLNADQFVGWFERTSIRGLPNFLENFLKGLNKNIKRNVPIKDVFRALIKEVNKKLAYINYLSLTDSDFGSLVDECYKTVTEINTI